MVSRSTLNPQAGKSHLLPQSGAKWKLMMGPLPGATLVPITKVSTFGTEIILECHKLKVILWPVIHQGPTPTTLRLIVSLITARQRLYRATVRTRKPPWILLLHNQDYLTTEALQ